MMATSSQEDQIIENVTQSTFGGFENVTKRTFEVFANTLYENVTKGTFQGFENVTREKYTADISDTFNSFMDAVETTSFVEVRNRTLVEIENITQMEMMDAPAPEFM